MAVRRKPIAFDTTLRNPERIAGFISVLEKFDDVILSDEVALEIEAEIIRQKLFEPTKSTFGVYRKQYTKKFKFEADDQSESAPEKVKQYYQEWVNSLPGSMDLDKVIYLLKNTITQHKEAGWQGGWPSRLHTQYNFANELGFVKVVCGEKIVISDNGRMLIKNYKDGYPVSDEYNYSYETSAFLNAFAKYQTNNPYRKNSIDVNFFPLVLNVIAYLDEKYDRPGISKYDLPFVIAWDSNDYEKLAEYIYAFRDKFGFNVSSETVYSYAMNLLDPETDNDTIAPASDKFIKSKQKDYKFRKITVETPDEIIRKLRQTMLISLRGNGNFIDINKLELDKIKHIQKKYSINKITENTDEYLSYMGSIDTDLIFDQTIEEENLDAKEQTIAKWAAENDWTMLKNEISNTVNNEQSRHEVLKYIKETVRLEFLTAIIIKKAIPTLRIKANYKADDEGIPFNTASGGSNNNVGADIDVYDNNYHVIVEPTISKARSMQVEHEIPSIRNHMIKTIVKDKEEQLKFDNWFAIFIAPNMARDVGDQVALVKVLNNVDIYPWDVEDFTNYSMRVNCLDDYAIIREYAKPQRV